MYLSRQGTLALVGILSLSLVGGSILAWRHLRRGEIKVTIPTVTAGSETVARVFVHVCGAVAKPGVYELPPGSRIYEAIAKAGGALAGADQEALNLAAKVRDGQQIYLPVKGPASSRIPSGASSAGVAAAKPAAGFPLSLNRSSAEELATVPGLGPVLCGRIVAYRQANGAFATVDDLLNVSGIGEKTLAKLRPYLTVP